MSSIYKTGIILSNEFDESDAMDIITSKGTMTYVPAKDAVNSCLNVAAIRFDQTGVTYNENTIFRIIAKVTWSGFDTSSTAGTFNMWWQGSNYEISSSSWKWAGSNYVTAALGSAYNPKTLVLSATSGSYIYDTTFTLPASWISTYAGSNIGFRADYSNGVGRITVTDIRIILDKYSSSGNVKSHIGNDYIAGREFIEI